MDTLLLRTHTVHKNFIFSWFPWGAWKWVNIYNTKNITRILSIWNKKMINKPARKCMRELEHSPAAVVNSHLLSTGLKRCKNSIKLLDKPPMAAKLGSICSGFRSPASRYSAAWLVPVFSTSTISGALLGVGTNGFNSFERVLPPNPPLPIQNTTNWLKQTGPEKRSIRMLWLWSNKMDSYGIDDAAMQAE